MTVPSTPSSGPVTFSIGSSSFVAVSVSPAAEASSALRVRGTLYPVPMPAATTNRIIETHSHHWAPKSSRRYSSSSVKRSPRPLTSCTTTNSVTRRSMWAMTCIAGCGVGVPTSFGMNGRR